ncbi:hypothetical protein CCHR01_17016 [Colletotrichum chrysophilum]|uniref:Uncharacterized protein n=1 Tax=Colletotrichum chrysophilum TaxID=1836956 RepID=A0AAD9A3F2_9PEZI|nr:hypothetical protein CCHR01_17016 [Colletotrichum chrysophilum]
MPYATQHPAFYERAARAAAERFDVLFPMLHSGAPSRIVSKLSRIFKLPNRHGLVVDDAVFPIRHLGCNGPQAVWSPALLCDDPICSSQPVTLVLFDSLTLSRLGAHRPLRTRFAADTLLCLPRLCATPALYSAESESSGDL